MLTGCTPWPEQVARRYREAGYWQGRPLGELLRDWADGFGDRTALVHGQRRISFRELDAWVDRLAAQVRGLGIAPGDRVVVQLPNVPEFVAVCFALFRTGAVPVFSLMAHRAHELTHLATIAQAVALVHPGPHRGVDHDAVAARVAAACPTVRQVLVPDGEGLRATSAATAAPATGPVRADAGPDASDVAFFLLSGGTTALPKLIPRTHDDYAYQIRAAGELLALTERDVYLAALPVEFNFAWGCPGVLGTLRVGGRVVLAEDGDPVDCFPLLADEGVTLTSLVPSLAQVWLEVAEAVAFRPPALRVLQIGGAPLQRAVAERIEPVLGCRLQQVFGMAEGLLSMTRGDDPTETVLGTQGRPLSPADEVRIVDGSGADVPEGQVGELLARGPYTLRGYYRAQDHNARAFTSDGFFRTGDLARRTRSGELVVEGRLKDVIIKGGNKISAAELEGHLLALPEVERVAVTSVPDEFLGERICAFVQPCGPPPTLAGVRAALRALGIADYKLPDRLEIVTDLPLTGLGKIDKNRLRQSVAADVVR